QVPDIIVNQAGARVCTASKLVREVFPALEVDETSAASIASGVEDPVAEVVNMDLKSIDVGHYNDDDAQKELNGSLGFVDETAVNQVGVNVNTASASLLEHVSGISKTVATNIVHKRNEEGKFSDRKELKNIPRLGAKTYEQGIGFLRIVDGTNPLDRTPIHPESYKQTEQLLSSSECRLEDIGSDKLKERLRAIDIKRMADELQMGEPTLQDIIGALI